MTWVKKYHPPACASIKTESKRCCRHRFDSVLMLAYAGMFTGRELLVKGATRDCHNTSMSVGRKVAGTATGEPHLAADRETLGDATFCGDA